MQEDRQICEGEILCEQYSLVLNCIVKICNACTLIRLTYWFYSGIAVRVAITILFDRVFVHWFVNAWMNTDMSTRLYSFLPIFILFLRALPPPTVRTESRKAPSKCEVHVYLDITDVDKLNKQLNRIEWPKQNQVLHAFAHAPAQLVISKRGVEGEKLWWFWVRRS